MTDPLELVFREVMASVATPVSIVTTFYEDVAHGTTVSAFTSLSMDPPMVLVSLDRQSDLLALIRQSQRFGVNVLNSEQAALARSFARKGTDKFAGVNWVTDAGLPRLPEASGWLACAVTDFIDGGDHVIALGTVLVADSLVGAPLVYHRRAFGTHVTLSNSATR